MRKSNSVPLVLTATIAATLTGCSSTAERDYQGVCVDKTTQVRVDDSKCRSGSGGHAGWYYINTGRSYPAVGGRVSGGGWSVPSGHSFVEGGVGRSAGKANPATVKGGTVHSVSKGGFGGLGGKAGS